MKTSLPPSYVEMALGPFPRFYYEDGPALKYYTAEEVESRPGIYHPLLPAMPQEHDAQDPFRYQMKPQGVVRDKNGTGAHETVQMITHTESSRKKFISLVKSTLSSDLITNGLAVHNFEPTITYQYRQKRHVFNVMDLVVFNNCRYPALVDQYIVDRMHELSYLAKDPVYIPATVNGEFVLFQATGKAGKELFQKYVRLVHKYQETLNMYLRTIDEWSFTGNQSPENLWLMLYNTKNQYGTVERVKL